MAGVSGTALEVVGWVVDGAGDVDVGPAVVGGDVVAVVGGLVTPALLLELHPTMSTHAVAAPARERRRSMAKNNFSFDQPSADLRCVVIALALGSAD